MLCIKHINYVYNHLVYSHQTWQICQIHKIQQNFPISPKTRFAQVWQVTTSKINSILANASIHINWKNLVSTCIR